MNTIIDHIDYPYTNKYGEELLQTLTYTITTNNGKVVEVLNNKGYSCRKQSGVFEHFSNKYNS